MTPDYEVWVDFFDDDYRAVYGQLLHPVRTEHEVASVVKLLALQEGARILDLCCGDGRHAVPLQRRGMLVCGVDLSPSMLRAAQARGARVLPEDAPQPLWILADAGKLPLRAAFDAVVLLYNSISFGTRAMTESLLANARRVLKPGGRLLVECTHKTQELREQAYAEESSYEAVPSRSSEKIESPLGEVHVERWYDPKANEQHAQLSFTDRGGTARSKHLRYCVYTEHELGEMIAGAGFLGIELFGGYDGRVFAPGTPAVFRASV